MGTHVLMNVVDEHELRVGVIRDGQLDSVVHERLDNEGQQFGNIYKAKVANVEASLDAAFLDLGSGKNGFIHVDDIKHDRGSRARIGDVVKPGDELVVQITKEAIKDKGPCVSTHLSVPGRCLVMMDGGDKQGVSRRIEDPKRRKRLRKLLDDLEAPDGFNFIVRTAGADRIDEEIQLDAAFLTRLWQEVAGRIKRAKAPSCVYQEADLVVRTLRDVVSADVESIIIDQEDIYDEARAFADVLMPEISGRLQLHRAEQPLFAYYGVEERLASVFDRKVKLPSGGSIVIEQTEALVSIDVNSGKSKEGSRVSETALHTNLEAVQRIAEQLVLRDLGGLVVVDFIDMEERDHRRLVQLALRRALATDKARTQVAPMSRFGLIEMTRQRRRPSHRLISHTECPHCRGTGYVKTPETFEIDCMRSIREQLGRHACARLEVVVPQSMLAVLLNNRRTELTQLEERNDTRITFVGDGLMRNDEFRVVASGRKRSRRRGRDAEPVRPTLLAGEFEAQARALAEVRELMKKSPSEVDRELDALAEGRPLSSGTSEASPTEAVAPAPVPAGPPSAGEEALLLRGLLFTVAEPVVVGGAEAGVASRSSNAKSSRSPARRTRRRRR